MHQTAPIDFSRPGRPARALAQAIASFAGAAGIALLVPFGILLAGAPVALAVRALLELLGWLSGARP